MRIHEKGAKADRDRAVILHSYETMCREFRVPRSKRLSTEAIARMTTNQLMQASRDLYNGQPVKKAKRLAQKLGFEQQPIRDPAFLRFWYTFRSWLLIIRAKFHARQIAKGIKGV